MGSSHNNTHFLLNKLDSSTMSSIDHVELLLSNPSYLSCADYFVKLEESSVFTKFEKHPQEWLISYFIDLLANNAITSSNAYDPRSHSFQLDHWPTDLHLNYAYLIIAAEYFNFLDNSGLKITLNNNQEVKEKLISAFDQMLNNKIRCIDESFFSPLTIQEVWKYVIPQVVLVQAKKLLKLKCELDEINKSRMDVNNLVNEIQEKERVLSQKLALLNSKREHLVHSHLSVNSLSVSSSHITNLKAESSTLFRTMLRETLSGTTVVTEKKPCAPALINVNEKWFGGSKVKVFDAEMPINDRVSHPNANKAAKKS